MFDCIHTLLYTVYCTLYTVYCIRLFRWPLLCGRRVSQCRRQTAQPTLSIPDKPLTQPRPAVHTRCGGGCGDPERDSLAAAAHVPLRAVAPTDHDPCARGRNHGVGAAARRRRHRRDGRRRHHERAASRCRRRRGFDARGDRVGRRGARLALVGRALQNETAAAAGAQGACAGVHDWESGW